jgi:hypothetical protein
MKNSTSAYARRPDPPVAVCHVWPLASVISVSIDRAVDRKEDFQ